MKRRTFIRSVMYGSLAMPALTACYGMFEATWVAVSRKTIEFPNLPCAFDSLRIAFLTDIHHGPHTDLYFVKQIVRTTNLLSPDVILLGGDYSLRDTNSITACFDILKELRAPHGVFGVLGNHDYIQGAEETKKGLRSAKITELINQGVWLNRKNQRLKFGGVDAYGAGKPNLEPILEGLSANESCLLISHNPDFAETIESKNVGLCLSGYTHGGQLVLPGRNAPFNPSIHGNKYLRGICHAPNTTVYVSRGLGSTGAQVRLGSRPEITVITLKAKQAKV
jgi:uncharacterized protein